MTVTLNGKLRDEFESPLTVAQLLDLLELTGQPVIVELDEIALRPREFEKAMIEDGARLEIVRIAAGG